MRATHKILTTMLLLLALAASCSPSPRLEVPAGSSVVRMVYFYATDCSHCLAIMDEVLDPLQADFGERIEIRWVEISDPANYELLVRTEEHFGVAAPDRGLPTLVIDGQVLIGEEQVRTELPCLLESCFASGGTAWPDIPGLGETPVGNSPGGPLVGPGGGSGGDGIEGCDAATDVACSTAVPIWAAYFYQVGCQECSRAEADIRYVRSLYPQLVVEEFNIYDELDVAVALMDHVGREWETFSTPAVFIGQDALIGAEEITPAELEGLVERYTSGGAEQTWASIDAGTLPVLPRAMTVALAGLVDGLNPCAFATLVFLVAYLAAGQRRGLEVIAVGGAFTLGVFLAYVAVGLGLYRVLELLGNSLTTFGRWVYGFTAALCAVLAILSFLDFLKARRGMITDMSLSLPPALRTRINAVIRRSQQTRSIILASFLTGVAISLLELACTGQVYLPTIIFISSIPELRAQAIFYLVLYNLLFVLPLAVVFVVTYFGTSSLQLGLLLKRHTAKVKLGTAVLFTVLAVWLTLSLLS